MKINFTTYFDKNYYDRFRKLYLSLIEQKCNFHLYCFLLSPIQIPKDLLKSKNLTFIDLRLLEEKYPELYYAKKNRSNLEYYFTLSPFVARYIFDQFKLKQISYIDADIFFFKNPEFLYKERKIKNSDIVLTKHQNKKLEKKYGKYNVGWINFKNTQNVHKCLHEWSQNCINWCFDKATPDKFADQKYLNEWPKIYKKIYIIDKKKLMNIGPWNFFLLNQTNIDNLVCYHFHNLKIFDNKFYISNISSFINLTPNRRKLIKKIYQRYIKVDYNNNYVNIYRKYDFMSNMIRIYKYVISFINFDFFIINRKNK